MENEKTVLISFSTEEHVHYDRTNDFYWGVGLATLVLVVLAFIFRDGLFGILLLIGVGMYFYISLKKPKSLDVVITNKDILIGDDLYKIENIESFNILDLKEGKELVLSTKRTYQPMVSVCIPYSVSQNTKEILDSMLFLDEKLMPHIGRRFMSKYKI